MNTAVSERAFEDAIEAVLLQDRAGDEWGREPGGYRKRHPDEYSRGLYLLDKDVLGFVQATQPKEWGKLSQRYGADAEEQFLARLSSEIKRRGSLGVLRHGVKDMGCQFNLAYFRPASGLNEETQRLYQANIFAVVRQLRYSIKNENSLDMVLFLNGLPLFTAELKNPMTGQTVKDAIRQYRKDRDPREPLFAGGRCLAHFAVDPEWVYVTTRLDKDGTRFLPFNQGKFGGPGILPSLRQKPAMRPPTYGKKPGRATACWI